MSNLKEATTWGGIAALVVLCTQIFNLIDGNPDTSLDAETAGLALAMTLGGWFGVSKPWISKKG